MTWLVKLRLRGIGWYYLRTTMAFSATRAAAKRFETRDEAKAAALVWKAGRVLPNGVRIERVVVVRLVRKAKPRA
jgi:hypothetical protein